MEVGDPNDRVTHLVSRTVLAMLAASHGDARAADDIRAAIALAEPMQAPMQQGETALNAAAVFQMLGDHAAEEQQLRRALGFFQAKGATAYVNWTNTLLEEFAARA
jgi:Cdc6-like AAA superfamily ATPase